jgi:hypothetical protein
MASDTEWDLLNNAAATGSAVRWTGGRGVFTVYSATFSGATIKLQWSPDAGTTWLDVDRAGDTHVTLTAVGAGGFELPPCVLRANVSGGPPSAVFAKVLGTRVE